MKLKFIYIIIILIFVLPLFLSSGYTQNAQISQEEIFPDTENIFPEPSLLNDSNDTVYGNIIIQAPFGKYISSVGGASEDIKGGTDGFPPAFDIGPDNRLYILDSANSRIMVSLNNSDKVSPLFKYPDEMTCTDISIGPEGITALADQNENSVFLFNRKGDIETIIKAVYPGQIAFDIMGRLQVYNQQADALMIFDTKGVLLKKYSLKGSYMRPVKGVSDTFYKIDILENDHIIKQVDFEGKTIKELKIPDLCSESKFSYYKCNSKITGLDNKGRLYVEHLLARDTDETKEHHLYLMFILLIDTDKMKITKKAPLEPFREIESLVAPRDYLPHPSGGVITHFISLDQGTYSIRHIPLPQFSTFK